MEQPDVFIEADCAPIGARAVAYLIDLVSFSFLVFVVFVGIAMASADDELHLETVGMLAIWFMGSVFWEVLWLSGPAQAKPGQRITRFRVLELDGSRVAPGRAVVRCAVRFVTMLLFPFGLIAQLVTLGASARNQGVHDVFGGTVCVRRSALDQVGTIQHVPTAAVTRREQRAATPSPIASRDDDASRSRGPFM